ncbi:hypothetical protein [Streptomyces sp. NPDC047061]|uniref:hypothetical protein n=1 Tax=Streptomyces sp. NPDC047061 TaxID=3154605 RepID=UPI0034003F19
MASRTRAAYELIRARAPFVGTDGRMDADIAAVLDLIRSGAFEELLTQWGRVA